MRGPDVFGCPIPMNTDVSKCALLCGTYYNDGLITVHINGACGLGKGPHNPYIKTTVLPDPLKNSKQKTPIQRNTSTPVFDIFITVRAAA